MIHIFSDDSLFAFGTANILRESGFGVNIIDTGVGRYNVEMTSVDIVLIATCRAEAVDSILVLAMSCQATVIFVISGMTSSMASSLWAHGVIPKKIACHQLAPAITRICQSNTGWLKGLTLREMEVMNELLKGKNYQRVSSEMHISVKTVSAHKNNALKKLGLDRINSRAIVIYGKYRQVLQQRLFS